MTTPADDGTIESQLAELRETHKAAAPSEVFLARLAPRRATRRRRVARQVLTGTLGIAIAATAAYLVLPPRGSISRGTAPIGLPSGDPAETAPRLRTASSTPPGPVTLASFRQLSTRSAHPFESLQDQLEQLFDGLPRSPASAVSRPLRLGDRDALLAESLLLHNP
ncbi:MAG: hypothetical protein Q9O74_02945 [Planctomycetota bacterium]|nr:hypothetical protein [Planctomycetota bacterium]